MSAATDLIAELRGFAEGSMSARATLMRDAADALEKAEMLLDRIEGFAQVSGVVFAGASWLPVDALLDHLGERGSEAIRRPGDADCAICGDDRERYEANHGEADR